MTEVHTLIVGASVAGLAAAASLQKYGIVYAIIEKHGHTATPWRHHYDRLHLHTNKASSHLPYLKFAPAIPRYPSRLQVVDYLEQYQRHFNIHPIFNTEASSIRKQDSGWVTTTNNGVFISSYVIIATGAFAAPKPICLKGMETFTGQIMHSYGYKSGKHFKGKNVLVVGFGNSACEIAMDLYEQGAAPAMSVRSAVNVVPRDVFGIPILQLSRFMQFLPPALADKINAPLLRWIVGDISRLGLKKSSYGPLEQILRHGKAPLLDIGTISHIRKGHIKIYGDIDHLSRDTIHFTDGRQQAFDAVVAAIGYYRDEARIIDVDQERFDDLKQSVDKQKYFGKDGLYFCGFWISPTGQIREISSDAQKIARDIWKQKKQKAEPGAGLHPNGAARG